MPINPNKVPKSIQKIIKDNLEPLPAPYEYRLHVSKHLGFNVIDRKYEELVKWVDRVSRSTGEINIIKEKRIVGNRRVMDIDISDPAAHIIDKLKDVESEGMEYIRSKQLVK